MDKKSWLQKLEAMEQEQRESVQAEAEEGGMRDFLEGRGKVFILGGIGVFVLVLLGVIFSSGKDTVSERQLQDIMAKLEVMESRLVGLESQEGGRQQSLARMQSDFSILTMRVDKLSREMKEQLTEVASRERQPAASPAPRTAQPAATPASRPAQPASQPATQAAAAPAQPRPEATAPAQAPTARPDESKPVLHEVSPGETLFQISRTYGVSVDEIRQLNRIGANNLIHPGQVLTIKK